MQNKKGRRTRKQILAEKEAASKLLVSKANSIENPLENLTKFHVYKTNDGMEIKLKCQKVGDIDEKTLSWSFELMEKNMKAMYERSSWGWNPSSKRNEMTESTAWYLIGSINEEPIAFSHFRYDMDFNTEVLYCYELQLDPKARRKGLGRFIMNTLEALASQSSMKKVVLTTFKHNPDAKAFYERLGYKEDKTSPPDWECLDYSILSK